MFAHTNRMAIGVASAGVALWGMSHSPPSADGHGHGTAKKEKLGLIIAGAPASGKGTQCKAISQRYSVKHISTGDALRAQVKNKTELGNKAKAFMDAGDLVPDELVMNIVKAATETVSENEGYLLDGVPRTMPQAEMLSELGLNPSAFILLNVPDEILVERITGRRIDPATGESYHVKFFPPPSGEIAARVYQRSDDTEEALRTRLVKFHENVAAVKGFYSKVMVEVDGNQEKGAVKADIFSSVDKLLAKKAHA